MRNGFRPFRILFFRICSFPLFRLIIDLNQINNLQKLVCFAEELTLAKKS